MVAASLILQNVACHKNGHFGDSLITAPTNISPHSSSLIDVILSTRDFPVESVCTIYFNFSLDDCASCRIKCGKAKSESSVFSYGDFKNFNHTTLWTTFTTQTWIGDFISMYLKINYNYFIATSLNYLINISLWKHFESPWKIPWLNNDIRNLMKQEDKDKVKLKRRQTFSEFKRLKNLVNHKIIREKKTYFELISSINNKRRIWVNINDSNSINTFFFIIILFLTLQKIICFMRMIWAYVGMSLGFHLYLKLRTELIRGLYLIAISTEKIKGLIV